LKERSTGMSTAILTIGASLTLITVYETDHLILAILIGNIDRLLCSLQSS
jgi:hypothetical protein